MDITSLKEIVHFLQHVAGRLRLEQVGFVRRRPPREYRWTDCWSKHLSCFRSSLCFGQLPWRSRQHERAHSQSMARPKGRGEQPSDSESLSCGAPWVTVGKMSAISRTSPDEATASLREWIARHVRTFSTSTVEKIGHANGQCLLRWYTQAAAPDPAGERRSDQHSTIREAPLAPRRSVPSRSTY